MTTNLLKRRLFTVLITLTSTVAAVAGVAGPANADNWLDPMTNASQPSCSSAPSVQVSLPANEARGSVRTEYLYRWNGAWSYTGKSVSATSNGSYYFTPYNGAWFLFPTATLIPTYHGYYLVYETLAQPGNATAGGWYTLYGGANGDHNLPYCTF